MVVKKTKQYKNSKNSKNSNKRYKKKYSRKQKQSTLQNGGEQLVIEVSYSGYGVIKNEDNLTGKTNIYSHKPNVNIKMQNANSNKNKTYLVIMTDPDAPNGHNNMYSNKNNTYIHWIYLQSLPDSNVNTTLIEYTGPTPPRGTHRYIFSVYDVTGKQKQTITELQVITNDNRLDTNKILDKFIKQNNMQPLDTIMYTVTAN
jgi:phosphatidylethanolamine-binding protein (PEBP) family uncharacterized protein